MHILLGTCKKKLIDQINFFLIWYLIRILNLLFHHVIKDHFLNCQVVSIKQQKKKR